MTRLRSRHPHQRRRLGGHDVAAGGAHALDIAGEARLQVGAHIERAHRARRGGDKLVHRFRAEHQVARRNVGRRRRRRPTLRRSCVRLRVLLPRTQRRRLRRRRVRGSIVRPAVRGAPALRAGAPRTVGRGGCGRRCFIVARIIVGPRVRRQCKYCRRTRGPASAQPICVPAGARIGCVPRGFL